MKHRACDGFAVVCAVLTAVSLLIVCGNVAVIVFRGAKSLPECLTQPETLFALRLSVKSACTADLSVRTHSTLNVDYIVLRKFLVKKPVNCCLAFLSHIRNNCCLVKALVNVDHTVEEVNLNTCFFCFLKNFVPACCLSC